MGQGTTVVAAMVAGIGIGFILFAMWRWRFGSTGPSDPAGRRAGVERVEGQLAVQAAELRRLADASRAGGENDGRLQGEIASARRALTELTAREHERHQREAENMDVVRRISTVLAGGSTKGRAGENLLHEHLAELPPGMLMTDFRVNGKVVEYGLLLPDGRRLPVDSKWSADAELESLEACDDPQQRERLAKDVERIVAMRAREVAAYLDPALTSPVAVAAIPDAAYAVVRKAHADAYARGVVIVPYSTALPVLLFLYALVSRYGDAGDVRTCLAEVDSILDGIELVLENKFERAATMLGNGTGELRSHLGRARGSLARARVDTQGEPVPALRAVD